MSCWKEPVSHLLLSLAVSEVSEVTEILLRVKNNELCQSLVFIIASPPPVAEGIHRSIWHRSLHHCPWGVSSRHRHSVILSSSDFIFAEQGWKEWAVLRVQYSLRGFVHQCWSCFEAEEGFSSWGCRRSLCILRKLSPKTSFPFKVVLKGGSKLIWNYIGMQVIRTMKPCFYVMVSLQNSEC